MKHTLTFNSQDEIDRLLFVMNRYLVGEDGESGELFNYCVRRGIKDPAELDSYLEKKPRFYLSEVLDLYERARYFSPEKFTPLFHLTTFEPLWDKIQAGIDAKTATKQ